MTNYYLILQDRYDETLEQKEYGVIGDSINLYTKRHKLPATYLANEIRKGDRVVLLGRVAKNRPSFYRGYCIVDSVTEYENAEGEELVTLHFSDYRDLNEKPRGEEFEDVKELEGYNDIHGIKRAHKLIFDEIVGRNRK